MFQFKFNFSRICSWLKAKVIYLLQKLQYHQILRPEIYRPQTGYYSTVYHGCCAKPPARAINGTAIAFRNMYLTVTVAPLPSRS
jgi:hypothetical protein